MMQTWPPSPCVEDEEVALAREHISDITLNQLKNENQPASSRGSVDQYPIILDNKTPDQSCSPTEKEFISEALSPDSHSKPAVNNEKRFVLVPSQSLEPEAETHLRPEPLHRPKSTTQLSDQAVPRGRPHVTRIHTDVGPGLEGMRTGHRRAPSPYAHTPVALMGNLSAEPQRKNTLLSPMHAHEPRRSASVHPRSGGFDRDSSDSDGKSKTTRRTERSRSRAARESFSHSDRSESDKVKSPKSSTRNESPNGRFSRRAHRYRSPAPPPGGFTGYTYTGQDHITPPQTPKLNGDSARSSFTDHASLSEQPSKRQTSSRLTADSPYTSSAEESHSRRPRPIEERKVDRGLRSRRNSRNSSEKDERPKLSRTRSRHNDMTLKDESNQEQFPYGERPYRETQPELSARTTSGMEDLLEKAFMANNTKHVNHGDSSSRHVSPRGSPATSPPQTPRGGDPPQRDYFEQTHNGSRSSKQRSRPQSIDDTHFKDLKNVTSLLGAATLGASLAAKAIPALSRSNTSQSLETQSSGSQSRPGSGQRSRKPSPAIEESQPAYQSLSRTNSTVNRNDSVNTRTTTYMINEERPVPKNGLYAPSPLEPPRTASRSSSYSHSPELRPPAPLRAFSSVPAQGHQQPLHFAAQPALMSSPMNLEPPTTLAHNAPRPHSLPPCPRSRPAIGHHDWYTIRDMPFLDFCPSCMSFLGGTRFRDHFIPSLPKEPRRPIACAMSYPWLRVAWLQSIRQDRKDLTLVWQIANGPPAGTKPCAGNKADVRRWYHLTDPRTKKPVDNFDICSACVRNIDLIFPTLQFCVFDRPQEKKEQEKICNLNTNSRHFLPILNELERLAERSKETMRHRDFQEFVDFVRRVSRNRHCVKDTLLATQSWHFISDLPEFTICEECFEEVVWPLRDRPIARDVSKTLKLVPVLRKNSSLRGTSCQLYSDRMRRIFHDAVNRNDFESLKSAARYRYNMEHRLQEMHKLYEMDLQAGIDRRAEMEKNVSIWKSIE
ncbi:hypothetical protein Z517_04900 [Fonsecaea pedrosoi CBS 271.37]|uniref:Uncharacterized protein n=1 Tax=Fonsecaea pedrosoi CBS 271.37 TaxID=1442368 RepID=A0A0D2HBC9_9EURO|nr:uncharacterized protein Z517_04900 [Fonsecaea pedrosoi CBS 271.37]KIW81874.1 hypothetical protein Z517_04900 [Fonsecaea pedrosoi CBS 271.37]